MSVIEVEGLGMTYRAPVRQEGLRAAASSLFRREYREIPAVSNVSFRVERGEVIGFVGPNGAGKTTTLKMLSGILHPTSGTVSVLSHTPWRREVEFLRGIAMIRGSRPLTGPTELTVLDALRFQQVVYAIDRDTFTQNLDELRDLLQLEPLLDRQIRTLSLGERMRAGLALSLVYRPQVLFLDEPTLGLDVSAVGLMRAFIRDYARQTGATILLTSHYMADVEFLCERILLIDRGTIRYDGDLAAFSATIAPFKLVSVDVAPGTNAAWGAFGEVAETGTSRAVLRIPRDQVPEVTAAMLASLPVTDLSVSDPSLELVMEQAYRAEVA